MRNLVRCSRGSVAFGVLAATIPLIGVVALGTEAGSWYIYKRDAQNAADAAAIAGALSIANTGAIQAAYIPSNGSGTVVMSSPAANQAKAVVTITVPQFLTKMLYTNNAAGTVPIAASAIAQVENPNNVCGLGLGTYSGSGSPQNALTIGGNVAITGNGCALMSDNTVKFGGSASFPSPSTGWAVDAANGCTGSLCANPGVPYDYYMPVAKNPLSTLNSLYTAANVTGNARECGTGNNANIGNGTSCTIAPNTPSSAYGQNLTVTNGGTITFNAGGTYFFKDARISVNGGTVTGTNINIVMVGNSSISITGATTRLSANNSNSTYPALNGVLIDDQAPNASNLAVTINGNGANTFLGGAMYFPNVDVTYGGTSQNANTTCSMVVANSITLSGNAYMSSNGCTSNTINRTQVAVLVQ